jgi:hypothetical protein
MKQIITETKMFTEYNQVKLYSYAGCDPCILDYFILKTLCFSFKHISNIAPYGLAYTNTKWKLNLQVVT